MRKPGNGNRIAGISIPDAQAHRILSPQLAGGAGTVGSNLVSVDAARKGVADS